MTTTINPFAGFPGKTREIDTRTAGIPAATLVSMDNAVAHFAVRQNKKQLEIACDTVAEAELFATQLRGYAAANSVHLSTLDVDDTVVTFRFAKVRLPGEDPEDDGEDDGEPEDTHTS
jgi:hypothetical protein